jgi:hypothetical protein
MKGPLGSTAVKTLLVVGFVVILAWVTLHLGFLAANVTASWTYDYAPEPACSEARSKACIDHFEVLDITSKDFVLITRVANPTPATGKVNDISTTFKYGPPFGQRTISVIAVGKDAKGDRVTSNPYAARGTASIRPHATVSTILR